MKERLQKILSSRGICSRRKAEEYIEQGLVKVNGAVAVLGSKADPEVDRIEVDGKVVQARKEMLYFVMNKPVGVVTENVERCRLNVNSLNVNTLTRSKNINTNSSKPFDFVQNKRINELTNNVLTVRDLLPIHLQGKIYPVGRLDKDTSGLLLFTNDGVLAYRLMHPKFTHEKEYAVRVEKPVADSILKRLEEGMTILGKKTKKASVRRLTGRRFTITLTEGRNRQIRRMCRKVGHPVKELRRIRIVTLTDDVLQEGKLRPLTQRECRELLEALSMP